MGSNCGGPGKTNDASQTLSIQFFSDREVNDYHSAKLAFFLQIISIVLSFDSPKVWKRAAYNTTRCLVGCSLGDFTMMFYLQVLQC